MGKTKPLISIVVGHRAAAPGALAVAPLSIHEYAYNTKLAAIIGETIRLDFDFVVVFRDHLTIDETYAKVGKLSPDGCIELHFNSAGSQDAYGTETLCGVKDVPFAQMIQTAMCDALKRTGRGNRGVKILKTKEDRGYASVSQLRVPSVIVEPFFGSNTEDSHLGLNSMQKIAEGIHKALQVWFLYDSDGSE